MLLRVLCEVRMPMALLPKAGLVTSRQEGANIHQGTASCFHLAPEGLYCIAALGLHCSAQLDAFGICVLLFF
jgi:hypothetical protein